jgi:hypothetical protein
MECGFQYAAKCSQVLCQGEYLMDSLTMKSLPQVDGTGSHGASSIRFFMETSKSIRAFMTQDMLALYRDVGAKESIDPVDATSLNMWLPFLRESYRIIGYKDISPQQKCWSMYHCECVAKIVIKCLDEIKRNIQDTSALTIYRSLKSDLDDLANRKGKTALLSRSAAPSTRPTRSGSLPMARLSTSV